MLLIFGLVCISLIIGDLAGAKKRRKKGMEEGTLEMTCELEV